MPSWISQAFAALWNAPPIKRYASLIILILTIIYGYRKLHQRPRRRDPRIPRTGQKESEPRSTSNLTPYAKYIAPSSRKLRVGISTPQVVFKGSGTDLQFVDGVVPLLQTLAKKQTLYLITKCTSQETEDVVVKLLKDVGILDAGLPKHRVLFCTTSKGKSAMFRQLELNLCIDDETAVLQDLYKFINDTILVHPKPATLKGCIVVPSLGAFFAPPAAKTPVAPKKAPEAPSSVTASVISAPPPATQ